MADTMTAIAVRDGKGPAENLIPVLAPVPALKDGQILVRVHAAGVNRPDIIQRLGFYPPPPGAPDILGMEIAGEVEALGPEAPRWQVGDRVTALLPGGGYAQYAAVDARHALPAPPNLGFVEAASLPETVFTVWANVFDTGKLQAGETFLVHGATSGIGVAAIQMAKAAGARVIATGRGAEKADQARALGADVAVDSSKGDWAEAVKAEGGADLILDMVGGDYTPRNVDVLKQAGRLVQIAILGGARAEIDLSQVMRRRLVITGSTLRPRSADEKARLARGVEATVWPWIAAGKMKPVIDSTFALADAAKAHARMEDGHHLGKIVLTM